MLESIIDRHADLLLPLALNGWTIDTPKPPSAIFLKRFKNKTGRDSVTDACFDYFLGLETTN